MAKKKILVLRFSSLGDVVLSTALFANLKAEWPESEVVMLTKSPYVSLFDGNPWIDRVLAFDSVEHRFSDLAKVIRDEHFDLIFDLHANPRSWFLRVLASPHLAIVVDKLTWARWKLLLFKKFSPSLQKSVRERILDCLTRLAVPIRDTETHLFPQQTETVLNTFGISSSHKLIGIAPGAKHATKRWLADRFAEVANRLGSESQTTAVLLGDKSDQAVGEIVAAQLRVPFLNLIGKTSLSELVAVTSRLSILLTNDSGLLHIGEALQIPLVGIFGPTVRGFGFSPYRMSSRLVEVEHLPCRPCTLHGDEVCPLSHHLCMHDISVETVLSAVTSVSAPKVG